MGSTDMTLEEATKNAIELQKKCEPYLPALESSARAMKDESLTSVERDRHHAEFIRIATILHGIDPIMYASIPSKEKPWYAMREGRLVVSY